MRFRTGLMISSVASFAVAGTLVACGGSSTQSNDAGNPQHDSGTTKHDSGKSGDSGKTSHDAGKGDAGGSNDTGTGHDAAKQDTGVDAPYSVPYDAGLASDADLSVCKTGSEATCALLQQCNHPGLATDYGDGGTCISRSVISCLANLQAPGTAANAAHNAACATSEGSESCGSYLNLDPPDACAILTGAGATGTPCSHPAQCASGFCAVPPADNCGSCQTPPAKGASCTELDTCGPDLACYKGTCIAYGATVGASCSGTQPCGSGLACVLTGDSGAGTCQTAGSMPNAGCDVPATPASCNGDLGLYCVTKAGAANLHTCQPVATATAGGACGRVDGVETICTAASSCLKADGGSVCVARAADNAACNSVTGPQCMAPARCIGTPIDGGATGTCILPGSYSCR